MTQMLKGQSRKGGSARQARRLHRKKHAAAFREGSGEHRPADINALVDESLNLAYHGARAEKAGFKITLQRDLDPAAGMVEVFPQEITRALLNLISNGFYAAMKRKGEKVGESSSRRSPPRRKTSATR